MHPYVRSYQDPYEGLEAQLTELMGLIKIVPPLIDTDRTRRWEEIGSRPGDPDVDMIDIYEQEAGPEEGWGHADFSRTVYSAAIVNAWAIFHDYLARQLTVESLRYNLRAYPVLQQLVDDERRGWDYRFDDLVRRYSDFCNVSLRKLPCWKAVQHAQELRNALVHNLGLYTRKYLNCDLAHRPTLEESYGIANSDNQLIGTEPIPLSFQLAESVILQLVNAAHDVRDAITKAKSKRIDPPNDS